MAKNNIRFGGADILIAESTSGPWTDLGHLNSVSMQESWSTNKIHSHNKGYFSTTISEHVLSVSAEAMEWDLDMWEKIRGSLDTYTTEAGTPVPNTVQTVSNWGFTTFIGIENQNGDGSEISVNSVTQDPSGTADVLSAGTDYIVLQNDNGQYGIMVLDTAATDTAQDLEINYDYTPAARKVMSTGAAIQVPAKALKLIQKTPGEDKVEIVIPYAKVAEGLNISFGDVTDPSEPLTYNIAFEAEVDPGTENLFTFSLVDEG